MQRILGQMRKAIQEFDLIQDGDRIAVGVSGGKDSLVLLKGLVMLRRFIGIEYELVVLTLDPMFGGQAGNYAPLAVFCEEIGVPFVLKPTHIGEIVFDTRKEKHPCSLCARLRRGALHDLAKENGCNKIALGHNNNDAAETFLMNLFIEGRVGCFSPKSYLSRKDLTMIRPLVFSDEKDIKSAALRNKLPIVKSQCPADGHTARQEMKEFLAAQNKADNGFSDRIFGALRRSGIDGWGITGKSARTSKQGG